MGQVFPPGGGAGYFVPTMTPAAARGNYYAPTQIPQMRAGPRWQTVRPGQPGGCKYLYKTYTKVPSFLP